MESMLSRIPPRPGIIAPESFTSQLLLKTDSARSPTIAARAINVPNTTDFKRLPTKISGQYQRHKKEAPIEPSTPPKKPTRLLLGLAFTIPRVDFPNKTPNSHAKLSQKKTIKTNATIKAVATFLPLREKTESLDTNVIR